MNEAQLARYLARIGHRGDVRPDLDTLRSLHRAHVTAIPFEALDAQLGRVPSLDPNAIFAKLVEQPRGGWCFETNGLFGQALEAIGFSVTRLSCGVMRQDGGDERMGTHLALLVDCGGLWLCDVGFGGSLFEPLPLEPGEREQAPYKLSLQQVDDGYWRYTQHLDAPFSYDFRAEPADEALFAEKCLWLARHPESNFTLNFIAQRRFPTRHLILRGRVLTEHGPEGTTSRTVTDSREFVETLAGRFGIDDPRAMEIWPQVLARHTELFETAA